MRPMRCGKHAGALHVRQVAEKKVSGCGKHNKDNSERATLLHIPAKPAGANCNLDLQVLLLPFEGGSVSEMEPT